MAKTTSDYEKEYESIIHGIQTAIKFEMEADLSNETSPKHLRVGVNSSLISNGAVVSLMVKKGLITEAEYWEELIVFAQRDLDSYRQKYPGIYFG